MKTNLIIIGENSQINKSVGQVLAEMLELNYLDFDGYCDYINLVSRDKVIQIYGKRKYNELQKETLPQMRDFCDSVIAFDEKVSRLPSVNNKKIGRCTMTKFDIELVGKVGSMALINKEYNDINYNVIARLSKELKPGYIWVTSGAAEIGRLDFIKRNGYELDGDSSEVKTDYAAQGQSILMSNYRQYMDSRYSLRQILVEHQHFNNEVKREYLKKLLIRCPKQNAIPIINYNDPLSTEEIIKMELIQLGNSENYVHGIDNDETASQIACLVKSKRLLIMTSVDGIYSDVNDKDSLVKFISGATVSEVVQNIEEYQKACYGASRKGAGGAKAKLEYIKDPVMNGTEVIIANSKYKLKDILSGDAPSTKIGVDLGAKSKFI